MASPTFPIEKRFSARTQGKYGFKDGHAEIITKIAFIPYTEPLTMEEINDALEFLTEAQRFADLPAADRERLGAD